MYGSQLYGASGTLYPEAERDGGRGEFSAPAQERWQRDRDQKVGRNKAVDSERSHPGVDVCAGDTACRQHHGRKQHGSGGGEDGEVRRLVGRVRAG
jgi:hypothetical protein